MSTRLRRPTSTVRPASDAACPPCPQFIQAETDQLSSVQSSLAEFRQLVSDIVQTACNTAMLEAGFPTEEYIEELALAVKCGMI